MKKTKLIALTMAVAIMMMGAGYAIWSDQVFLDTTIRTGDFDMQITKATVRTGYRQADNEVHHWHHFDWTDGNSSDNVTYDANTAVVELKDLYPGGVVQVDMTTTNNGTIPAKLASVNVQFLGGNADLFNSLLAKTTYKVDINGDKVMDYNDNVQRPWQPIQTAMNTFVSDTINNNIVVEPEGWLSLGLDDEDGCIQFKLSEDAPNALQNQSVRFKMTFNWEQWTTNPNSNPYHDYGGDGDLQ